ncbi:Na+/H+ antiporter subunit C [Pseudoxanthomonas sp. PXM03]|uniref:Na+/H+ antiporter subunit C n=1 Tax=Pseudoxanthomonas sp. PXM03 TaxID=2769284 RepID=UPI0017857758|nr:Na+/H+ antiporter subunit C [Pseudoxanthomonas sp. PXM03]MBD9435012.1 Na+/H+ antiporter subunit C [Pseudoxanthomonas sp. PXM03]
MELALASAIGILTAAGVYLLLRARSFDVILGLTLLSYATNLLIFAGGRLVPGKPAVLRDGVAPTLANYTDPLPQALVLTAIVIAFAMTAVTVVLAIRSRGDNDSDHVDGPRAERDFLSSELRRLEEARDAAKADDAGGKA